PADHLGSVAFQLDRSARSPNGYEAGATFSLGLIKLPAHLFCLPTYRTQHCPVGSEGRSQPRSISRTTTIRRLLSQSSSPSSPAFILMDDRAQPALADGLHLPQGHRLGLVLPVHRA